MASIIVQVTGGLSSEDLCRMSLDCTATVHDLKEEVARATGVTVSKQRLLLGCRAMRDCSYLEDLLAIDSSQLLEVSLLRSDASEDPHARKQAFEHRYLDCSFGRYSNRWEYHRVRAHTETDLNTGWGDRGQLFVKLHHSESHAATFNLCSLDFPLSELFDTFSEQTGVAISQLRFFFQGRCLGRESTPRLCGMNACSLDAPHEIKVEFVDGQGLRQQIFAILNSMGDAMSLKPNAQSTIPAIPLDTTIGADNLMRAFMFLSLQDLLSTTQANTIWFHATQRLSLMLQLRHGDLAFMTGPPQEYVAWLTSVFGHSQQLALAEAQNRRREVETWQGLNISKEKAKRAYTFTKAAGCTQMKTVSLAGLSAEFEQQWLSLHSSKTKFMAECQDWCKSRALNGAERVGSEGEAAGVNEKAQELPPQGAQSFSTEAVSPEFCAVAVELFRRYFSPDMYFIFPLIVFKEAAFGLDFRSTTTTLFFGPQLDEQVDVQPTRQRQEHLAKLPGMPAPAGACSWRFRWPLLPEIQGVAALEVAQPLPLLEVLFIAVWEEQRYQVHGGSLVADLEAKARMAGIKMLYVEIGFEQPQARRFWRKQGFGKAVRAGLSESETLDIQEAEELEQVLMPLVALPDVQFDFFDSNCLRFADTAQYVKLLQ